MAQDPKQGIPEKCWGKALGLLAGLLVLARSFISVRLCTTFAHMLLGTRKATQTFYGQSFSTTLRVMEVRAENHRRPHQIVRFPAALLVGRNWLTPGHPGVRVRNVRRKSGPRNVYVYVVFSSLRFPGRNLSL